ncbi:MAG: CPBP family intramembrane metalloprotease [Candidatus Omnitrophica bacterium]|nr:CPBP family intramembrane metalloprotease [Candidatus Omnitrophota bacterium]
MDFIKFNRLYILLAIFLVTVHIFIWANKDESHKKDKTASLAIAKSSVSEKHDSVLKLKQQKSETEDSLDNIFDANSVKTREDKIKKLVDKDPKMLLLLAAINLSILFLIISGIIADISLFCNWVAGKPLNINTNRCVVPGWGLSDVLRAILIFMSVGYAFGLGAALFSKILNIKFLDNQNFAMIYDTAFINIAGISVILYFMIKKHGHKLKEVGLTLENWKQNVFSAYVGYVALIPVVLCVMALTLIVIKLTGYKPPMQPIVKMFVEEKNTGILWAGVLFASFFGPFAEELFFRGFFYPALKKKIGVLASITVTSGIFALLHAHWVGFAPIFILGVLLAYLFERTGSLVSCIAVHVTHNMAMVLLVFVVKALGVMG